jgi:hypothetical protein
MNDSVERRASRLPGFVPSGFVPSPLARCVAPPPSRALKRYVTIDTQSTAINRLSSPRLPGQNRITPKTEFAYKSNKGASSRENRNGGASTSAAAPAAGLPALPHPIREPFNLAENARLALEAKSAMVEKLQARLAEAETAMREGEDTYAWTLAPVAQPSNLSP